jgi:hypothetical protein
MKLEQVIQAAGARISGGDPFMWSCWGDHANYMEFRNINGEGYSHCIYDTKTYQVYLVYVEQPNSNNLFQWFDPEAKVKYFEESKVRNIDPMIAFDDIEYTLVEKEVDILTLMSSYGQGIYFVPELQIPIAEELEALSVIDNDKLVDDMRDKNKLLRDLEATSQSTNTHTFVVELDVKHRFEVTAVSYDEASKVAFEWHDAYSKTDPWVHDAVVPLDSFVVKEVIQREFN